MTVITILGDNLLRKGKETAVFVGLALCVSAMPAAAMSAPPSPVQFEERTIRLSDRVSLFVQVAQTPLQRARGLMYREDLAPYDGMLFDMGRPAIQRMWMKNTPLALDMLFYDCDQKLVDWHASAVPHSLEVIASAQPACFVLELPAGKAAEYRVQVGEGFSWVIDE